MPSEQEIQYHRTFLKLWLCERIWDDDARHQNTPGGPPGRQRKIESDPEFKYHVHSCPIYPQKPPGTAPQDRKYHALLARNDGGLDPLVIIPKRGQRFASAAVQWELTNSVLCSGSRFSPVVNSSMEVTGHYAKVRAEQLIHPKGINFTRISDYITNEIEIYLWMYQVFDASRSTLKDASQISLPPGWEPFDPTKYNGGVSVLVLPNGKVIGAEGHLANSNSGEAISVMSPFDFWTPGQRLVASAIRGLTNRVGGAVKAGFQFLKGPTKELAELSVARIAGKTLTGFVGPTGALPLQHLGRRTIIMGEDMAIMRTALASSKVESGFYDVVIHGDDLGFYLLEKTIADGKKMKEIWREVSVREVANVVRARLAPGDKIRLLACQTGGHGGPAQQLANELKNHTVWAPSKTIMNVQGEFIKQNGKLIRTASTKNFVPLKGGKFHQFFPQPHRGAATLAGKGGNVPGNVVKGEIGSGSKK